jgi:hypothetical protein
MAISSPTHPIHPSQSAHPPHIIGGRPIHSRLSPLSRFGHSPSQFLWPFPHPIPLVFPLFSLPVQINTPSKGIWVGEGMKGRLGPSALGPIWMNGRWGERRGPPFLALPPLDIVWLGGGGRVHPSHLPCQLAHPFQSIPTLFTPSHLLATNKIIKNKWPD